MVRAILAGTKTQTRRIVKIPDWNPIACIASDTMHNGNFERIPSDMRYKILKCADSHGRHAEIHSPYGQPGDRLWVKETWATNGCYDYLPPRKLDRHCFAPDIGDGCYRATTPEGEEYGKWRPSIFLPRWASRITLEITAVRVERLQDITEADAIAEGVRRVTKDGVLFKHCIYDAGRDTSLTPWAIMRSTAVGAYADIWKSINGPDSWDANPYVWVIEFQKL